MFPGPPQQRNRVYIMALLKTPETLRLDGSAITATLLSMQGMHLPIHLFLRSGLPPSELTQRQKARLEAAQAEPKFQKMLSSSRDQGIFVDLAKT